MFEQAILTAKQMDSDRKENPTKPLPPLYGLPISLKDSFKIPGVDATIGFVSLANKPSTIYSALPELLKDLGAVFYCKTNIPQTLMCADSDNNLFGRALNPHNTALTAGGSSGGEGALVAMRGSILGVGTDIAGSIRIPACADGTYGFKPTAWIIPYAGQQSPVGPGVPSIMPVAGPLATSARACGFFMETVMKALPWKYDGTVLHLPWVGTELQTSQPLRIGYMEDNGMTTPTPPMRRALRECVQKLKRAGHEMVPVKFDGVKQAVDNCWAMYTMNGSKDTVDFVNASGEPFIPAVGVADLIHKPAVSLPEMVSLIWSRMAAQAEFVKAWNTSNIDFLITPGNANTAVPHDTWLSVSYTALWNYLDWPSAILPVGKVSSDDVKDNAAKYGPEDERSYKLCEY